MGLLQIQYAYSKNIGLWSMLISLEQRGTNGAPTYNVVALFVLRHLEYERMSCTSSKATTAVK